MLTPIGKATRAYLAYGATDMRKSIDGLAALVELEFQRKRQIQLTFTLKRAVPAGINF